MTSKNHSIILVEDDPAIVEIYQTMIQKAGFLVEVISSGQDILRKVKAVQEGQEPAPDLILLDLILPDVNGMDVLANIRGNQKSKDIKVFILTNQQESDAQKSPNAKPDKFIIKANTTPTELVETIKKALH